MLFHFVGLKDISEKNYPLDVLIQADDTTIVKDFLSEQKIITLGLEIYNGDPQDFWNIFLSIPYQSTQLKVFIQFESVEKCLESVAPFELEILDINYTKGTLLSPQEVQQLIQKSIEQNNAKKAALASQKKEEIWIKQHDPRLKKAYEAIEEIINQIEQVQEIGGDKIEPLTRKKLEDMRWNISKLRLATNYDNIIEELHNAMNLIVMTQDFLLEKLESTKIYPIFSGSQVNNVEVIREQTRLAKAQLLQALWAQLTKEETMYASLGYLKLFSQYLEKDIRFALNNKLPIVQQFFKIVEITSLLMMIEFAVLTIFAPSLGLSFWVEQFAIALLYLAPFALMVGAFNRKVQPTSLVAYGLRTFGGVLLYLCVITLLKILLLF